MASYRCPRCGRSWSAGDNPPAGAIQPGRWRCPDCGQYLEKVESGLPASSPGPAAGSAPLVSVHQEPTEPSGSASFAEVTLSESALSEAQLEELRRRVPPIATPEWQRDPEGPNEHLRNALQVVSGLETIAVELCKGGIPALVAQDLATIAESLSRRIRRALEQSEGGWLYPHQRERMAALLAQIGTPAARAALEATPYPEPGSALVGNRLP